jgi:serine/threonine protein kinase
MGGKCCGLNPRKHLKILPKLKTENNPIDTKVLYSDSHYFTPSQQSFYNQLLLEEACLKLENPVKDWETSGLIGCGSYGRVLMGRNKENDEALAIKEIPLVGIFNVDSVCEEFKILSQLHHPNIVEYKGFHMLSDVLLIFMEFIAGGTVETLLNQFGPFQESFIKKCSKEILKGLEYLHFHNIVHRDLKGNNILFDQACKLADFGSAKNILGIEETRSVAGTLNWMAPEVLSASGHGRFADIWSFGCLVVEMATGKQPWHEVSNQLELDRIVCQTNQVPKIPDTYSENLKDFFHKCFERDPYKRPNVCELLSHSFLQ